MERQDTINHVLHAVGRFLGRKLWKRFTNYDCFGVRIEGRDERILGVVLGNAGEEYGLSLFCGPQAVASFAAILNPGGPGDDALADMDTVSFTMAAFEDLPVDAQELLRQAGRHRRYEEKAPHFLTKLAGELGRLPNESEFKTLGLVLEAVVGADERNLLQPAMLSDPEGICVIRIQCEADPPVMTVMRERWTPEEAPVAVPLVTTGGDLDRLPRLKTTWLAGLPSFPGGIEGDERAMQMLLVVDDADNSILQGRPVFSGELRDAADCLVETFRGKGLKRVKGLPRELLFSSRKLFQTMAGVLEPLGVRCRYVGGIPKLKALMAEFRGLAGGPDALFEEDGEAVDSGSHAPAVDDLKGWKEANQRLSRCLMRDFAADERLSSPRGIKRYFNDDDLDRYLQKHEQQRVVPAYVSWAILDYRPTRTSKTHAERMLAEGLPEPMGSAPIRVPRDMMLHELGLVAENRPSSRADQHQVCGPAPIESVPVKPAVSRNAPCSCGSGRKYKNCCGRES